MKLGAYVQAKVIWLLVFVLLYWFYCIFWGIKGTRLTKTATDFFQAGRKIPIWVFILAATATSFSGWTFMGHPGLLYLNGFQYAYASFYAIGIPFTGTMFLKRQWMLGKRFSYVTPGDMFSDYFKSDLIRILTVIIAMFYTIPYIAVQLRASGLLFKILSDDLFPFEAGILMIALVVLIFVALGGVKAIVYVDTMQFILLATGIIATGIITLYYVGGWKMLMKGIEKLAFNDQTRTPDGYSHYIAMPGIIQFVKQGKDALGGEWTGMMCLTYMFALMGIQAAPTYTMWAFSNKDPKPFAPQQVWASSCLIGFILIVFTAMQGLGGHFLGLDASMVKAGSNLDYTGLGMDIMLHPGKQDIIVPALINLLSESAPWAIGLLSVCALAAMQSTAAPYLSAAGGIITRDFYKHFINKTASHEIQILFGKLSIFLIIASSMTIAIYSSDALVLLGGLAVAYGFQMWPALIAVCYWPWLTRSGINAGLIAGILAVTLTESIGVDLLGIPFWGRWPLTMHSAGWGIFFNLGLALTVSLFTQNNEDLEHKMKFHNFLREHASVPEERKKFRPAGWILTIAWFVMAIGPGAIIGNNIFGDPNNSETWIFGMPSIWAWQIIWWAAGVAMMWMLAYYFKMSIIPKAEIKALVDDAPTALNN